MTCAHVLSRPRSRPNPFFPVLDIIGTEDNKTLLPPPIEIVPQGFPELLSSQQQSNLVPLDMSSIYDNNIQKGGSVGKAGRS